MINNVAWLHNLQHSGNHKQQFSGEIMIWFYFLNPSSFSFSQVEFLLDEAGWKDEAAGVIKDISSYVTSVTVAESLPCSNSQIFLNLVTKENKNFTVALNPEGFKIVGFCLDTIDTDGYDDLLLFLGIF